MTDRNSLEALANPFTWRSDIQAALAADKEDDAMETANRIAAEAAARLAAEGAEIEAANAAAEAAVAAVAAEPPDSIVVDTNGLSPGRARLVRFVAWLAALEAEHDALVAGRERLLETQGVPSMTKRALAQLIADDRSGLVALMASGGDLTKHQLRTAERKKLEAKLTDDEHQRDVALGALADVEQRADNLEQQIATLKGRHKSFVADALAEVVAESAGPKLVAKMDSLHADALKVMGGAQALQVLRGVAVLPRRHDVLLPMPRLDTDKWITGSDDGPGHYSDSGSGYLISFELHQQMAEQRAWLDKAAALLADPHADIGDDA